MEKEIYAIVAKVLKLEPAQVKDSLTPNDVEHWDSLKHMQIIFAIEDALGVTFSDEAMTAIDSVGALVAAVKQQKAA